ncbi:MAG TPA: bacteriohopanetetrol glucosamine biosynthesis glycosyltransferase HpnI [Syntrophobacteraceae bacterium]|nr:bacteriohopanetetrol glucosamine biosynthesis glycosyltransferase HpnI [Syntrophobacteraceae bacterium]
MIQDIFRYGFALLVVCSLGYFGVAFFAARKFFRRGGPDASELPPASILIPLHGSDVEAYENYASFCLQDYPRYQIVFGVTDPEDPSVPLVRKLGEDFPQVDLELVVGTERIGRNPKVNNLWNIYRKTKYDRLVLVDSDIRVERDYLRRVVPCLNDGRTGLVTCLYRGRTAPNWASGLEAVGITGEFAPGVLVAWLIQGIRFAFGATIAVTREALESIGGLKAVADYLADDYMLGHLVARKGYGVELSPCIVETMLPPVSFSDMLRHQIRWGRAIKAGRKGGYLGSALIHGTALALLNALLWAGAPSALLLLFLAVGAQMALGWYVGVHFMKDRILKRYLFLLPLRDLLGLAVWCMVFCGNRVVWRGKTFRISSDGKMTPSS